MLSEKNIKLLPQKCGTYSLIILVTNPINVLVGALGICRFNRGFYSYTGSALGPTQNLSIRVARHLRKTKKIRWHIDYLLEYSKITSLIYCISSKRRECLITKELGEETFSKVVVKGFGSSDCVQGCAAHLYYHPKTSLNGLIQVLFNIYRRNGCDPLILG